MQVPLFPVEDSELDRLALESHRIRSAVLALNTLTGYAYDWAHFTEWCARNCRRSLPATPDTLILYLTYLLEQDRKVSTAARRNCAIAYEHRRNGYPSPVTAEVYELLRGAQRLRQEKPRQMRALTVEEIRAASAALRATGTRAAIRARAVLVLGFASALRRVNLARLMPADIAFTESGLLLTIRREKQDQEGKGRIVGIPPGKCPDTCAVTCLREWLELRGDAPGPVFSRIRHDRGIDQKPLEGEQIARMVKQAVSAAGGSIDRIGGHSLRSGFVTATLAKGVNEIVVANHTGHRSLATLRRYYRPVDPFRPNACVALDL